MTEGATMLFHGYPLGIPLQSPQSVIADISNAGVTLFVSKQHGNEQSKLREKLFFSWETIHDVITYKNIVCFSGQPNIQINNTPAIITAYDSTDNCQLCPRTALCLSEKFYDAFCSILNQVKGGKS